MPRVSIVTPTYNGERFLARTIESLRAQALADWEHVIVDDGSRDGTLALARTLAAGDGRVRVVAQENRGVADARNRGFAEVDPETPYVLFLDQDDLLEPDALASLVEALEHDLDAVGAHGWALHVDDQGQPYELDPANRWRARRRLGFVRGRVVSWQPHKPTTFAVLVFGNVVATPGQILIRRQALRIAGPFDSAMAPADDWDMWLRLSSSSHIAFIDRVVVGWRQHEGNVSRQARVMTVSDARVRKKILLAPGLTEEHRRLARRSYRLYKHNMSNRWLTWATQNVARGHVLDAAKHLRHALIELAQAYGGLAESFMLRATAPCRKMRS